MATHPKEAEIIVYQGASVGKGGESLSFSTGDATADRALEQVELMLRSSNDRLRLGVTADLIETIKQSRAVEIRYAASHWVGLPALSGPGIDVQRLLVPLEGDLAGDKSTIFWGTEIYRDGPLRSPTKTSRLAAIVTELLEPSRPD